MAIPIIMPRQGQSVESCILTSWNVREGETVAAGQIIASIETDKATFDVECPGEGTILALFFPEGADIPVLTNIAAVGQPGEDPSSLRPGGSGSPVETVPPSSAPANPLAAPVASSSPSPEASVATDNVGISPRARKASETLGIPTRGIVGSGPAGRVIERDVIAARNQLPNLTGLAKEALARGLTPPLSGSGPGGRVVASDMVSGAVAAPVPAAKTTPVKGIRKIIAEKMKQSLLSTAQLTLTRTFDATVLQSYRARAKEFSELLQTPKVTINDLIVYATIQALKQHPALNAHFLGDRIVESAAINLGIAVDTPRGLMVPVVQHAEAMTLADVAKAIKPLAESAQKGNVNPDLLAGGTFTITNLGALGVETFTPVLNPPEVAILGVGGIVLKPVRKNGDIVFVDAITLSLTIDHQAVDGAPAARFLKDLCILLENIDLLLGK